ncbi:Arm DNA-binding domain-containing protein [Aureimonas sp. SA4125]|uniref:Arm DNA-binding domain-containing protein n=1 Tax=Aureimonas sp. SA4125 TaxID=2826993 RepID=UPI0031F686CD
MAKRTGRHPDKALTAVQVRNLKVPGRYADGNGLYLVVDESGARRWLLRSCPSTWWKLSVAEAAPFQATSVEICSGFAVLPMAMRSAMGSVCM